MGKQSPIVNVLQYMAARSVLGFMHCFDVNQNLDTVARIGSLMYRLNRRRSERARRNVAASFPQFSPARVEEVVERSWQHMLQLFLVDSLAGPKLLTADGWPTYVELGTVRAALPYVSRGHPAIMISGHVGNWEMLATLFGMLGFPIHALARPIDNPLINSWLLGMREAKGARIVTKWGALPVVQEILDRGELAAFIADQNAGDQGLFVPFFGRLASSYKSIGLLAMRHEVPIIAGMAQRLGGEFRFRIEVVDVITPEQWTDQPDPLFYITARYNRAIEQMVRRAPEQYIWVHRRWKSRPRHERLGRPFPPKLIAKLRQLPWMTQAELDRIVAFSELSSQSIGASR